MKKVFILDDSYLDYKKVKDALLEEFEDITIIPNINSEVYNEEITHKLTNLESNSSETNNSIFKELYDTYLKDNISDIKIYIIDRFLKQYDDGNPFGDDFVIFLTEKLSEHINKNDILIIIYSNNAREAKKKLNNLQYNTKFEDKTKTNDTDVKNIIAHINNSKLFGSTPSKEQNNKDNFWNKTINFFIADNDVDIKLPIHRNTIRAFGILIFLTILAMILFFLFSIYHLLTTDNSESSLLQFVETVFVLSIPLFIFHAFLNFYLVSLKPMLVDSGYSEKSIIQSKKQLQLTKTLFISSILSSIIIKLVEYISISAHHTAGNNTHPTNNIANDKFANKFFELIQEIPLNYYYFIGLILIIALILMFYLLTLHIFEHKEEKKNNTEN